MLIHGHDWVLQGVFFLIKRKRSDFSQVFYSFTNAYIVTVANNRILRVTAPGFAYILARIESNRIKSEYRFFFLFFFRFLFWLLWTGIERTRHTRPRLRISSG